MLKIPSLAALVAVLIISSCAADKIDNMAKNIKSGLMNSPVLGPSARFTFRNPRDLFYRVASRFLAKAGMNNPDLAELIADTGAAVGTIPSCLFFKAIGYHVAQFLDSFGFVTDNNLSVYSTMYVNFVEQEALKNGGSDPESVANAIVFALYDQMDTFGLVNADNMSKLFNLFSKDLLALSGKSLPPQTSLNVDAVAVAAAAVSS